MGNVNPRTGPSQPASAPATNGSDADTATARFLVHLPAGGAPIALKSAAEVAYWNDVQQQYTSDYGFSRTNDLVLLGAVLSQTIAMYRAQLELADPKRASAAVALIGKASEQIRELEKALGVDKKSREAGGQHTMADYVTRAKRAAHEYGIHISDRVKAYEDLAMELRWRIRVLRNGDDEDRRHHKITEGSIIKYAEQRLAELEEKDKEWAREKGRLFIGQL